MTTETSSASARGALKDSCAASDVAGIFNILTAEAGKTPVADSSYAAEVPHWKVIPYAPALSSICEYLAIKKFSPKITPRKVSTNVFTSGECAFGSFTGAFLVNLRQNASSLLAFPGTFF
jgi:hypothetical protein